RRRDRRQRPAVGEGRRDCAGGIEEEPAGAAEAAGVSGAGEEVIRLITSSAAGPSGWCTCTERGRGKLWRKVAGMKTDSNYYVYAYFDPRSYKMLYVGKGKGS